MPLLWRYTDGTQSEWSFYDLKGGGYELSLSIAGLHESTMFMSEAMGGVLDAGMTMVATGQAKMVKES